jgi:outer membrane receptor protein involved in Fe transport
MRAHAPGAARAAGLALLLLLPAAPRAQVLADADRKEIGTVDVEDLLDLSLQAVALHVEKISETAASVFVLTGEDIRRQDFQTLMDALRSVPGLFTYRDDLYPMLGVRGVGQLTDYTTRILVLVDGHPLNSGVSGIGNSYLGRDFPVPLVAVHRVEVIKGPMGSIYGANAFLAVVNVVTVAPGEGKSEVHAFGEGAQSRVLGGGGGGVVVAPLGPVHLTVALSGWGTTGYDWTFPELAGDPSRPAPPGGTVKGMGAADALDGYVRLGWQGLSLVGACGGASSGIPSAPYESNLLDPRSTLRNRQCYGQASWAGDLTKDLALFARASYDVFDFRDAYAYPEPPAGYGLVHDLAFDHWASGELRLTWRPLSPTLLVAGATTEFHQTSQTVLSDSLPPPAQDPVNGYGVGPILKDYWTVNAYLLWQQDVLPTLRLDAGLTAYWNQIFGSRLTPRVALLWQVGASDTLKAIYSEGFRAPTVVEAYFEDGTDFLANPDLKPERTISGEVVYDHRFSELATLSASAFVNEYYDLIRFVTVPAPGLGRPPDPANPADYRQQAVNVGNLGVIGGEIGFRLRWKPWLQTYGGVSFQWAGETGQVNFPAVTGNLALSSRALWDPLILAANMAFGSARDKDPATIVPGAPSSVPAYFVLNAAATFEVPGTRTLGIQLGMTNITGTTAPHPVPGDFAPITEIPEAPRTLRLTVRYRFE